MVRSSTIVRLCSLLATAWLASACSGSDAGGVSTPPAPPVERLVVTISPKYDTLLIGASKTISASVTTTSGLPRSVPVQFTSLTPAIASVSNGTVTALARGVATIVATAGTSADTATLVVTLPSIALQVSPSAVAATLGDTLEFQATIVGPSGAATAVSQVTWGVSDSSAAQVVGDGTITTLAPGELLVSAEVNGTTALASVRISSAPVASIAIVPSNVSLLVGGKAQLTAELRDSRGRLTKGEVSWTSSNPAVATISADGLVTATGNGGVIITARNGKKSATAAVNVSGEAASSVTLALPNDSLGTGRTMQAAATPLDANGNPLTGRPLAWQSSNPSVATINNSGVIAGYVAGQTTISVICDGKIASQKITVVTSEPYSLTIIPSSAQVLSGGSAQLSAEVRDQFGNLITGRTITWSSSASTVASVNGLGVVTGVSTGSATVRATTGAVAGTSAVTVQNVPVASVTLSPTTASVEQGATVTLVATARDAQGNILSNRPVSWTTSAAAIATVTASGMVQGVAPGSADITATVEGKSARATLTVTAPPQPQVTTVSASLTSTSSK